MRPWLLVLGIAAVGCAQVDSPNPEMVLPTDYRTAFVQVRGCRASIEHFPSNVIVRVRPELASLYESGPYPFPEGALVVKEEYRDSQCQDLTGYTAVRKEKAGYYAEGADWQWFRLDSLGTVMRKGHLKDCANCHSSESSCPGGKSRDLMCTEQ
jgi:cytochrome P460